MGLQLATAGESHGPALVAIVSGLPAGSCGAALKAVAKLTRQKAHTGAFGPRTLTGPSGFRCLGTGILSPASAGFCGGSNGAKFFWAPRLKTGS